MIEKVNPSHPDKVADRIAGAIVDLAYTQEENPKVAVEVLIGHGRCLIITESSVEFNPEDVYAAVSRITNTEYRIELLQAKQDAHLAGNQNGNVAVSGIAYISIKAFTSTDASTTPADSDYTLTYITVTPRQKAYFDESRIEVEVDEN